EAGSTLPVPVAPRRRPIEMQLIRCKERSIERVYACSSPLDGDSTASFWGERIPHRGRNVCLSLQQPILVDDKRRIELAFPQTSNKFGSDGAKCAIYEG